MEQTPPTKRRKRRRSSPPPAAPSLLWKNVMFQAKALLRRFTSDRPKPAVKTTAADSKIEQDSVR